MRRVHDYPMKIWVNLFSLFPFSDENECEYVNGGCVHFCSNNIGNFSCSCKEGFTIAKDGHNCIGK